MFTVVILVVHYDPLKYPNCPNICPNINELSPVKMCLQGICLQINLSHFRNYTFEHVDPAKIQISLRIHRSHWEHFG